MAVKVTLVPEQILVVGALMLTAGVTVELPSLIPLLAETVFCKHGVAFDVRITYTESPTLGVLNVKLDEFVPAFVPFSFH